MDSNGRGLEQGDSKHRKMAGAMQGCSYAVVGKNKRRAAADSLEMSYARFVKFIDRVPSLNKKALAETSLCGPCSFVDRLEPGTGRCNKTPWLHFKWNKEGEPRFSK
jgi:hypothetical protein